MMCIICRQIRETENVVVERQVGIWKRVGGVKYIGTIPMCSNCMNDIRSRTKKKSKTSELPPIDILD